MARTVEVELFVDASGAVKAVDAAGTSFRVMAEDARDAGQEADQAMDRTGDGAQQASRDVDKASRSMRRFSNSADATSRSGSKATQILFSAGDAAQDVQFGFAGASNNIAFMAEQFVELQQDTGSSRAALQAITSSLMGVGGLIFAFQALLALAPSIISFFQDTESQAEDTEDTIRSLVSALVQVGPDLPEFEPISAERAQELYDQLLPDQADLQERLDALESLQGALQELENLNANARKVQSSRVEALQRIVVKRLEELGISNASLDSVNQMTAETRERLNDLTAILGVLKEQGALTEDQARLVQKLKDLGFQIKEDGEDTAEAYESVALNISRIDTIPFQTLEERLAAAEKRYEAIKEEQKTVLHDAGELVRTIAQLAQDVEVRGLEKPKDDVEAINTELELTSDLVAGALVGGFQTLGAAIADGQSAMAAFGQAAASIISTIAAAIGEQLVAIGTALVASSFIPGSQANAGAGLAYIAAGGTLLAASSALGAIGGGGGGRSAGPRAPATSRPSFGQEGGFGGAGFNAGLSTIGQESSGSQQVGVNTTVTANISIPDPFELENIVTETTQQSDSYLN